MKICFIVRSIYRQLPTHTTTHLAYEAHLRGHDVYYSTVNSFGYTDQSKVQATVVSPGQKVHATRDSFLQAIQRNDAIRIEECLSKFDVVFLRYNPNGPEHDHNVRYSPAIEFGRLLQSHGVLVLNSPPGLERASSKMYLSSFPARVRPHTLVTRSAQRIKAFIDALGGPAIIKPLAGYGGKDVFFVKNHKEININQIISAVAKNGYVLVQEYICEVKKGDKRVLLLDGSPIYCGDRAAAYLRVSAKGEIRSNIHVGGTRHTTTLTKRDLEIIETIRPKVRADGLYFVGIDIVGDKLLEINVFCPGGINNINELYQINVGKLVIEDLERRVGRHVPVLSGRSHRPSRPFMGFTKLRKGTDETY